MPLINKPNQHFDVITYTGNGKAVTVAGNAQISTAQSKFGGSSALFDGTGDYLNFNGESDFAFGTGDFTIEFWVRFAAITAAVGYVIYDSRPASTNGIYPTIYVNTSSKLVFLTNNTNVITSTTTPVINTWYHVAVCRSGTSTKLFINGTQEGSTYTDSNSYLNGASSRPLIFASGFSSGSDATNGYLDDLRIYKGVAKYTANFTAPTAALPIGPTDPNWQYCVLAMPMDGTNTSTTFPTFSYNASTDSALSFKPDLVWIKGRSGATDHAIYDAVRGATKDLASNLANAEVTNLNGLGVFNANGFTVGNLAKVNTSAATYAAWCWKAGNSTSTNTAGSITSTVSVNPSAGFSVVSYSQGATNGTVGHGLGVAPGFILVKSQTIATTAFVSYHRSLGSSNAIGLNSSASATVSSNYWGTPGTNTFGVLTSGVSWNNYGSMIAYCWAEVPGFSSFGSYTGNGNANGPFINLGFRPALLIIKCSSAVGDWVMLDDKRAGYNVDNDPVWANLATAEGTTDLADLLSNGFKIRTTDASVNTNAATYIYCAWAENPFKYSLAR